MASQNTTRGANCETWVQGRGGIQEALSKRWAQGHADQSQDLNTVLDVVEIGAWFFLLYLSNFFIIMTKILQRTTKRGGRLFVSPQFLDPTGLGRTL